ncbi:MAG TPA: TetR/AcrR family transcriptional regulator [Micromonospora sp.]|nr:TetR/AcrR family transcriptional regulator [Micromonospora sp.]
MVAGRWPCPKRTFALSSPAPARLTGGGPQAISLRAIAHEMGMTAPAIYRYFPSLDALVIQLTRDLFDEVRQTLETAREAAGDDPAQQLAEMARSFRQWSVAHPAEFALVFGAPVPGISTFDDDCAHTEHPAAAFGALFTQALLQLWRQAPWPTPPSEVLRERLGDALQPLKQNQGDMPLEVAYTFLSGWVRLYGLISIEVNEHLGWAVTEPKALFEAEIRNLLQQLTAGR